MKRVKGGESSCLIPGLPDDVAWLCLLRVPAEAHKSCKRVSKSWNSIFKSNRIFSTHRKESGFRDPWLVVFACWSQNGKIQVKILNLATLSWHTEHTYPQLYHGRGFFTSASIPHEGVLFAFGGVVCFDSTANAFLRYESGRWTITKAMTGRLGLLTAGVIDGKVYVTGLNKELSDGEHEPVEVFDPEEGKWKPVLSYARAHHGGDFHSSTVFNGKLLLTYYDKSERGQIYDPRTDKWEDMGLQLSKGLRDGCAVEVHGHLFVFAPGDESGLRVYDAKSDGWDLVEGINALPTQRIDYLLSSVSCWEGKIYVVTDELAVLAGMITTRRSSSCSSSCKFRVQWERIVDPPPTHVSLETICTQVLINN